MSEQKMREALEEAMGWNWLDGDVPPNVVSKCEEALAQQPVAVELTDEPSENTTLEEIKAIRSKESFISLMFADDDLSDNEAKKAGGGA